MKKVLIKLAVITYLFILFNSCTSTGPGLFKKRSPHEHYILKLKNAGLDNTALGKIWIAQAENSLINPLSISVPYEERGYFAADRVQASALVFQAKRGQKLTVSLNKRPEANFQIYLDLWEKRSNDKLKLLTYADTSDTAFSYEIDNEGSFLLRLQPELLVSGEYTLTITAGPSLAFPVKGKNESSIQSLYGVERDAGARQHEGVDIFASRLTPVIAAASGIVTRVGENRLGGKVVFLRPQNKDYSLYYAHLDSQIVQDGDIVNIGDTLGLVGNTGNARLTSPHLHFGIYTRNGAVDPLPYIDPRVKKPNPVIASLDQLSKSSRANSSSAIIFSGLNQKVAIKTQLPLNTLFRIDAATTNLYKITLPDGTSGFIRSNQTKAAENPIQKLTIAASLPLFDKPDSLAARKMILPAGETVNILGVFNQFYYVTNNDQEGWLKKF